MPNWSWARATPCPANSPHTTRKPTPARRIKVDMARLAEHKGTLQSPSIRGRAVPLRENPATQLRTATPARGDGGEQIHPCYPTATNRPVQEPRRTDDNSRASQKRRAVASLKPLAEPDS